MLNFKTNNEPMDIGNEAITPHYNDPAIKELLDIIYEIYDVIKENKLTSSDLDNPSKKARVNVLKESIIKFEKVVKKRFGFDVKIQIRIDQPFSFSSWSIELPKSNDNVFYSQFVKLVVDSYENSGEWTEEAVDLIDKSHERFKDSLGVRESGNWPDINVDEVQASWKNVVLLHNQLNISGITIDDNKVYISGLPDKYYAMLNMYFFQMFSNPIKLTPEEILAVFLHELGHSYTFMSYVYRCISTSIIFDDAVKDYVRKNNGTPYEMVEYIYSKVTKGQKPNSKNTLVVYNDLMKIIANPILPDGAFPANKNSEILADQFSNRFGYGQFLVSGLNKIYEITGLKFYNTFANDFYRFRRYYENSIFHFLSLTVEEISNRSVFLKSIYYTITFFVFTKALIKDFFWTLLYRAVGLLDDNSPYEEVVKRFDRIKKDIIRSIRVYGKDMNKEDINKLIDQMNYIDTIVNKGNKLATVPFVKFKNFVTSLYKGNRIKINKELYDMEILAEDLTENMLHVYKHKLKGT